MAYEIAYRIGVPLEEVKGKSLKTLGSQQPQECADANLPVEMEETANNTCTGMETGEDESEIASRIRVSLEEVSCKILKTLGTQQPKECSDSKMPEEMLRSGKMEMMNLRLEECTFQD